MTVLELQSYIAHHSPLNHLNTVHKFDLKIIQEAVEKEIRPNLMNKWDDSQQLPQPCKHILKEYLTKQKSKNVSTKNTKEKSTKHASGPMLRSKQEREII